MARAHLTRAEAPAFERALPGVWRWADPGGADRCGTALATAGGLVLVDPPALPNGLADKLAAAGGNARHVVLTSARHLGLAAPFRRAGAAVWAPRLAQVSASGGTGAEGSLAAAGVDHAFGPGNALPGGLIACQLPLEAAPDGEVALLWPGAGEGLLLTGDVLPVVGQTPVYCEGEASPVAAYLDALRALLAAEPGTLAPARHSAAEPQVIRATGSAASVGTTYHARRAAPVFGPRYLVPQAVRVLQDALAAPVVVRRPRAAEGAAPEAREGPWLADPFACARCGRPNQPMPPTCGGPAIARLCPACRAARRRALPAARVMVCAGGCCTRDGARAVVSAARQAVAARGLADTVDVVPVSCLGECSLGPFVRVSRATGEEPAFARDFRERTVARARRYAADEGEEIDDESELVLSRFAALVQPAEAARLIDRLAVDLDSRAAG